MADSQEADLAYLQTGISGVEYSSEGPPKKLFHSQKAPKMVFEKQHPKNTLLAYD